MTPLSTQLLKPNTSEPSLRPVFLSLPLFSPSAGPVFPASCVYPVPGTSLHLYVPSLVHTTTCLGYCKHFPKWLSCFHFRQTLPCPLPCFTLSSVAFLVFLFPSSHTGFLSIFSWRGLCTCCSCCLG